MTDVRSAVLTAVDTGSCNSRELAEKLGIDLKALLRDTKAAGEKEKVPLEAGCFEETIDKYNCSFRNRID